MTITQEVLERWGLLPAKRKKSKKRKHNCPKCMEPQELQNFSFGEAWVCVNDDCNYKRPYTTGN